MHTSSKLARRQVFARGHSVRAAHPTRSAKSRELLPQRERHRESGSQFWLANSVLVIAVHSRAESTASRCPTLPHTHTHPENRTLAYPPTHRLHIRPRTLQRASRASSSRRASIEQAEV